MSIGDRVLGTGMIPLSNVSTIFLFSSMGGHGGGSGVYNALYRYMRI